MCANKVVALLCISKATFGKTIGEYKQFKGLEKPNQNLRDHMSDWELILTMVGEKATTDITVAKDAKGLPELKVTAKEGWWYCPKYQKRT